MSPLHLRPVMETAPPASNSASDAALLARLDHAIEYPLTLLIAPPRSGKTALLRHWAASRAWPSAWLDLATGTAGEFDWLTRVVEELEKVRPGIQDLVASSAPETLEDRTIELANALALVRVDLLVILDHYDWADSPGLHQAMTLLLEFPPPALHFVIASAAEPPLPLARLRARGQMLCLDLRLKSRMPDHRAGHVQTQKR
jgi:LuxR family maltose regulon positive regulatory protein